MRILVVIASIASITACGTQQSSSQLRNNAKNDECFQINSEVAASKNFTVFLGKFQKAGACTWGREADFPSSADLAEQGLKGYSWSKIVTSNEVRNAFTTKTYLKLTAKNASIVLDIPLLDEKILLPPQIIQQYPDCFSKNEMPDFAIEFPETSVLGIRYNGAWESKRCGD